LLSSRSSLRCFRQSEYSSTYYRRISKHCLAHEQRNNSSPARSRTRQQHTCMLLRLSYCSFLPKVRVHQVFRMSKSTLLDAKNYEADLSECKYLMPELATYHLVSQSKISFECRQCYPFRYCLSKHWTHNWSTSHSSRTRYYLMHGY
jgi:hypothetical protein